MSAPAIETRPVGTDRRLTRAYVDVPWRVYRDDERWVPPLKSEMRKQLNRRVNPFYRHADVEHFVAFDGGEAVGRVAATVYPSYNRRYGGRTGFFGFFEAVDEPAVAEALLATAEGWLRERGMTRISGPYNYCSTQEMGLMIDGFDRMPAIFQTYNPSYYTDFFARCGYEREFAMEAGEVTRDEWTSIGPMLRDRGDAVSETAGLSARPIDMKRYYDEMELVRRLFNESFAENSAVTPFEQDVFAFQVKGLKPFVKPELVTIVERHGEPVAFTLLIPNLNELLAGLGGSIGVRDLLGMRKSLREIRSAVLLLIGALPRVHGLGIGRTLLGELFRAGQGSHFETLHTTWIHEGNWTSRSLAAQWQLRPAKRYVIVGREI